MVADLVRCTRSQYGTAGSGTATTGSGEGIANKACLVKLLGGWLRRDLLALHARLYAAESTCHCVIRKKFACPLLASCYLGRSFLSRRSVGIFLCLAYF